MQQLMVKCFRWAANASWVIRRLEANGDPLARRRGEDITQTIDRARRLQEQLEAMATAGPLERLYVTAKDIVRLAVSPPLAPSSEAAAAEA
jgi:hypothetical protein